MSTPAFQRRNEDFTCGHCGRRVSGNGYTNHCPSCLWSRHVDVNPGDRASECGGLMRPVGCDIKNGTIRLVHVCEVCGQRSLCKTAAIDDSDAVIAVSVATTEPPL